MKTEKTFVIIKPDGVQRNFIGEIIQRIEETDGKRTVTIFKVTNKGMNFCHEIIEPYEKLFPRRDSLKQ